ncbi:MAG: hypothetical protein ABSG53_08755, partial [Thermoguttaceae bacterium]
MKTKILISAVAAGVFLAALGCLLWRSMGAPFYTPGMVRAEKNLRGPLEPPKQSGEAGYWLVENDIRLFYAAKGEGRPILFVHGGPGYPIHGPVAGLELLAKGHKVVCYDQRGC